MPQETRVIVYYTGVQTDAGTVVADDSGGQPRTLDPCDVVVPVLLPPGKVDCLSDRETEVMRLVAQALTNPEIADELSISVDTVKLHVTRLIYKLGARNRADVVIRGLQYGLLTLAELCGGRPSEIRGLSLRETQVLQLIASGLSRSRIARRLNISASTVTNIERLICKKWGVVGRADAVEFAVQHGLVADDGTWAATTATRPSNNHEDTLTP